MYLFTEVGHNWQRPTKRPPQTAVPADKGWPMGTRFAFRRAGGLDLYRNQGDRLRLPAAQQDRDDNQEAVALLPA